MKNLKMRTWNKYSAAAFVLAATLLFSSFVLASAKNHNSLAETADDFKAGDRVEVSTSGLEGDGYYEPCLVLEVLNTGYRVKCDYGNMEYVVQKGWVRALKKPEKVKTPPAKEERLDEQKLNKPTDDDVPENIAAKEDCDSTPPGAKVANTDKFSQTLARRKMYDRYAMFANGTLSAPLKVGVKFLSLQIGKSFTNIARRGVRINDAAPVNTTIYQIKSTHIVCEQYRDRTLRRQVASNFACFKNRDGEWVCGVDGVPKITQLN